MPGSTLEGETADNKTLHNGGEPKQRQHEPIVWRHNQESITKRQYRKHATEEPSPKDTGSDVDPALQREPGERVADDPPAPARAPVRGRAPLHVPPSARLGRDGSPAAHLREKGEIEVGRGNSRMAGPPSNRDSGRGGGQGGRGRVLYDGPDRDSYGPPGGNGHRGRPPYHDYSAGGRGGRFGPDDDYGPPPGYAYDAPPPRRPYDVHHRGGYNGPQRDYDRPPPHGRYDGPGPGPGPYRDGPPLRHAPKFDPDRDRGGRLPGMRGGPPRAPFPHPRGRGGPPPRSSPPRGPNHERYVGRQASPDRWEPSEEDNRGFDGERGGMSNRRESPRSRPSSHVRSPARNWDRSPRRRHSRSASPRQRNSRSQSPSPKRSSSRSGDHGSPRSPSPRRHSSSSLSPGPRSHRRSSSRSKSRSPASPRKAPASPQHSREAPAGCAAESGSRDASLAPQPTAMAHLPALNARQGDGGRRDSAEPPTDGPRPSVPKGRIHETSTAVTPLMAAPSSRLGTSADSEAPQVHAAGRAGSPAGPRPASHTQEKKPGPAPAGHPPMLTPAIPLSHPSVTPAIPLSHLEDDEYDPAADADAAPVSVVPATMLAAAAPGKLDASPADMLGTSNGPAPTASSFQEVNVAAQPIGFGFTQVVCEQEPEPMDTTDDVPEPAGAMLIPAAIGVGVPLAPSGFGHLINVVPASSSIPASESPAAPPPFVDLGPSPTHPAAPSPLAGTTVPRPSLTAGGPSALLAATQAAQPTRDAARIAGQPAVSIGVTSISSGDPDRPDRPELYSSPAQCLHDAGHGDAAAKSAGSPEQAAAPNTESPASSDRGKGRSPPRALDSDSKSGSQATSRSRSKSPSRSKPLASESSRSKSRSQSPLSKSRSSSKSQSKSRSESKSRSRSTSRSLARSKSRSKSRSISRSSSSSSRSSGSGRRSRSNSGGSGGGRRSRSHSGGKRISSGSSGSGGRKRSRSLSSSSRGRKRSRSLTPGHHSGKVHASHLLSSSDEERHGRHRARDRRPGDRGNDHGRGNGTDSRGRGPYRGPAMAGRHGPRPDEPWQEGPPHGRFGPGRGDRMHAPPHDGYRGPDFARHGGNGRPPGYGPPGPMRGGRGYHPGGRGGYNHYEEYGGHAPPAPYRHGPGPEEWGPPPRHWGATDGPRSLERRPSGVRSEGRGDDGRRGNASPERNRAEDNLERTRSRGSIHGKDSPERGVSGLDRVHSTKASQLGNGSPEGSPTRKGSPESGLPNASPDRKRRSASPTHERGSASPEPRHVSRERDRSPAGSPHASPRRAAGSEGEAGQTRRGPSPSRGPRSGDRRPEDWNDDGWDGPWDGNRRGPGPGRGRPPGPGGYHDWHGGGNGGRGGRYGGGDDYGRGRGRGWVDYHEPPYHDEWNHGPPRRGGPHPHMHNRRGPYGPRDYDEGWHRDQGSGRGRGRGRAEYDRPGPSHRGGRQGGDYHGPGRNQDEDGEHRRSSLPPHRRGRSASRERSGSPGRRQRDHSPSGSRGRKQGRRSPGSHDGAGRSRSHSSGSRGNDHGGMKRKRAEESSPGGGGPLAKKATPLRDAMLVPCNPQASADIVRTMMGVHTAGGATGKSREEKVKVLWGKRTKIEEAQDVEEAFGANRWDQVEMQDAQKSKMLRLMGAKAPPPGSVHPSTGDEDAAKRRVMSKAQESQVLHTVEEQFTAGLRRADGRTVGLGL